MKSSECVWVQTRSRAADSLERHTEVTSSLAQPRVFTPAADHTAAAMSIPNEGVQ